VSSPGGRALARAGEMGMELPEQPGATGTVDFAVAGPAGGDVHAGLVFVDGRLTAVSEGAPPAADLSVRLTAAECDAVVAGTCSPSVAYMRGRLRTAGDNRLLLAVLAATATPAFTRWSAGLRDGT
jgi:hypothetical protein